MSGFHVPQDLEPLLAGDRPTWSRFVDAYLPNVYSVAIRLLRRGGKRASDADVDEVVSDVFHRLVKDDFHLLRGFDPSKSPLHIWMGMVTRSTAINWLKKKRLQTVPIEESVGDLPGTETRAESEPVQLPEGLLSSRQELVLRLLFDRDLSHEEAAAFLGVSEDVIRMTKSRALAKLREFLESEKKDE
jgi:RNA polymerase sigma-70 factor (ECF subfamily)